MGTKAPISEQAMVIGWIGVVLFPPLGLAMGIYAVALGDDTQGGQGGWMIGLSIFCAFAAVLVLSNAGLI